MSLEAKRVWAPRIVPHHQERYAPVITGETGVPKRAIYEALDVPSPQRDRILDRYPNLVQEVESFATSQGVRLFPPKKV